MEVARGGKRRRRIEAERVGKKRCGEKRGVGRIPLHSTVLSREPNSPIAEKLTLSTFQTVETLSHIELDRPQSMEQQHILR